MEDRKMQFEYYDEPRGQDQFLIWIYKSHFVRNCAGICDNNQPNGAMSLPLLSS